MAKGKGAPGRGEQKGAFRPQKKGSAKGDARGQASDRILAEAKSFMETGKYSRAASSLKEVLEEEPQNRDALRLSATLQLKLGGRMGARAAFESLAQNAIADRNYREAESLLREYLEVGQRYVPFLELLGEVLEASGDSSGAAAEFGKAIDILVVDEDPDLTTKGAELYDKILQLDSQGLVAQRFAGRFSSQPIGFAPSSDLPAPPTWGEEQVEQSPGAGAPKPWEGNAAPAPFPWEAEGSPAAPLTLRLDSEPAPPSLAPVTQEPSHPTEPIEPETFADPQLPESAGSAPTAPKFEFAERSLSYAPHPDGLTSTSQLGPETRPSVDDTRSFDDPTPDEPFPPMLSMDADEGAAHSPDLFPFGPPSDYELMAPPEPGSRADGLDESLLRAREEPRPVAPRKAARRSLNLFPTVARIIWGIAGLFRLAFTSVRAFVTLCVWVVAGAAALALLAVTFVSLIWIVMEETPDKKFQTFSNLPAKRLSVSQRNGYLMLGGLGTVSTSEPIRVTRGRTLGWRAEDSGSIGPQGFEQVAGSLSDWYATKDPAAQFQRRVPLLGKWRTRYGSLLREYGGWIGEPFEDLGYGLVEAPDEHYILAMHRLYVAEGFTGGLTAGILRLQGDLETWRQAFALSRTLRLKSMAAEAMQDDLAVLSGLLARRRLDAALLPALSDMARPLGRVERSMRWPMRSQFILEMESMLVHLKSRPSGERAFYQEVLTHLPLPTQHILNGHAKYYGALAGHDSAVKREGDPRKGMPQRYRFVHTPPKTFADKVKNPIDNVILVGEPRVDWEDLIGRMTELEARFRLATLQARLRKRSLVRDPVSRIVKLGQKFYDPFTGFPMLFNGSKTVLYSVGRDGTDNDGDSSLDVSVPIRVR